MKALSISARSAGTSFAKPLQARSAIGAPLLVFVFSGWLQAATFDADILAQIDATIESAIDEGKTPGGVLWLERRGERYVKAYGARAIEPKRQPARQEDIYDSASLTKVIATTPAIMKLIEEGAIHLDAPASLYLDCLSGSEKAGITIRHLLTHTSGLAPGLPSYLPSGDDSNPQAMAIELACLEPIQSNPGSRFRYSDINFILLGEIVQRVSGEPLEKFVSEALLSPLGMNDTGFHPSTESTARIAPTQRVDGGILQGVVHDPTARKMGGIAGHAGLFSTASDLARFARMMLNKGSLEGVSVFQPETVELMTAIQSPGRVDSWRGLGWDIDSAYSGQRGSVFPIGGYGHTGFTGPSIWIDPFSEAIVIFMCNRIHPHGSGDVRALRRELGTLAANAIQDFDFDAVSDTPTKVRNGIDVLQAKEFALLEGLRIGLITNHTGRSRHNASSIDLLHAAENVALSVLFSPEHGIRGEKDEKVGDSVDERTGLGIYSLYGENRKPDADQIEDLDALVFDIQDIGCRFYTYLSTMGLAMEAAAENGTRFIVLDRVNPLGGMAIEGPIRSGESEFIAYHDIPIRHGMTVGELARMIRAERQLDLDLEIVPIEGWRRDLPFDQTGLLWINPSPNIRSLTQALLYPGIGLLETTNLSVGRGTDTPFEVIGAPYIDALELAEELNRLQLPGLRFYPIRFTPSASKFAAENCQGVTIALVDRSRCQIVQAGVAIAHTLHRLYGQVFELPRFNRLLRHPQTVQRIEAGHSWQAIVSSWSNEPKDFEIRREPYLLY